jgi:hypothetical protein
MRLTIFLLLRGLVAAGTSLPSSCLATTSGVHIEAHRFMGGIYEVTADMGSVAMIYISSFIKTGSDIQKWMADTQTHR